jgi:tetratricopeptide (TPR) repeat protein
MKTAVGVSHHDIYQLLSIDSFMSEGTTSYPWWRNDASVIAALVAFAAIAFTATYFISKSFGRTRDALARHWLQKGDQEMMQSSPSQAVAYYRTALLYSHNDSAYRLRLAQALAADNQRSQAIAYFLNLLEEQPGNGFYNLQLARLYSTQPDTRKAALYYNGAIYGAWEIDPAVARRGARAEFIQFLLQRDAQTQAQAEAMILAAGVYENDIQNRFRAAKLLLDTGEFSRALEEYSSLTKADPVPAALGAGQAAFQAGHFDSAVKYLSTAIAHGSKDPDAASMLQHAKKVIDSDPDRRRLPTAEQARRVTNAFEAAGRRLDSCVLAKGQPTEATPPATHLQNLYAERLALSPTFNQRKLAGDPDLRDSVMDFVLRVEQATAQQCGTPTGPDWALLMLARYGEGVEH